MKKILSFCLILIVIACLSVVVFAENGVKIVKTDIKADRLFNSEGFGSIFMKEKYADDGETVISLPQAALIDKNGNFVFPYEKTWLEYRCCDGIVSKVYFNAYNKFYLDTFEGDFPVEDLPGFYSLDGKELFSTEGLWGFTQMTGGYALATKVELDGEEASEFFQYVLDRKGNVVMDLQDGFKTFVGSGYGQYYIFLVMEEMAGDYTGGLLDCWKYAGVNEYPNDEFSIYYMDLNGEKLLELPRKSYVSFNAFTDDGLAVVQTYDGRCGFIDKTGNLAIPCEYEAALSFKNGAAGVCKDGLYGYIDKNGDVIIPFEYENVFGAAGGLYAVVKDGKCGLVDAQNNVIVPFEYDDISSFEMNTAYAVKDGYVYIITGEDEIFVKVDGRLLQFDVPPILQNDRTLVPFRAIFEALGATVDWDDETQTVFVDLLPSFRACVRRSAARPYMTRR
ncbi:MAG: WG repeat-containing protein [Clostridia bacterium]|nr:WG repeat-containing protein [Clostridia bacterium]